MTALPHCHLKPIVFESYGFRGSRLGILAKNHEKGRIPLRYNEAQLLIGDGEVHGELPYAFFHDGHHEYDERYGKSNMIRRKLKESSKEWKPAAIFPVMKVAVAAAV